MSQATPGRRPRAVPRLLAQALLSFGLFMLPIVLVANPISASYKRWRAGSS